MSVFGGFKLSIIEIILFCQLRMAYRLICTGCLSINTHTHTSEQMNKILIDYDWVKLLFKAMKNYVYTRTIQFGVINMHISVQRKLSVSFDYVTEI